MARPGGYSSEEDFDDDDFFGYDFGDEPKKKVKPSAVEPTPVRLSPNEQLLMSARNGDPLGLRTAIENGANVHCVGEDQPKWTAIMLAADNADVESVKILLDAGANPNDHCEMHSVLMVLCASPSRDEDSLLECCNLLLKCGAHLNASNWTMKTPLMLASAQNHVKLVEKLLGEGANIEACDNSRWTPIFFAVHAGHSSLVSLLKDRGANLTVVDKFGQTLNNLALDKGLDNIAALVSIEEDEVYDDDVEARKDFSLTDYFFSECPNIRKGRLHGFQSEVTRLLSASDLRMLIPAFVESQIQLGHMLVWDESQWDNSGTIPLSFYRKKVTAMSKKFHQSPWGKDSLRVITPDEQLSIGEVTEVLSNVMRQFHIISLTSHYCQTRGITDVEQEPLDDCLHQIRRMRSQVEQIRAKIRLMADSVDTPDLICRADNSVLHSTCVSIVCLFGLALTARYFYAKTFT